MSEGYEAYDKIIVAFSGGKDSLACVLHLLELDVPKDKIELWHHRIDPVGEPFMDWPCTPAYCQLVADHLELPLLFSWKEGGYKGELLRNEMPTRPTSFETPDGSIIAAGGKGPEGTRRKFPQMSGDLRVRWCSAYLKIDVGAKVFTNDPRFAEGTFLMVTGERGEESPGRANYNEAEPHRTASEKRRIVQWRPVLRWLEPEVWAIIERWGILPHPAYRLGWGRVSCAACIFGDVDQWRTLQEIAPSMFNEIARLEDDFDLTIRRKRSKHDTAIWGPTKRPTGESVGEAAQRGTNYVPAGMGWLVKLAFSEEYFEDVGVGSAWTVPVGAFKKSGGPT